MAKFFLHRFPFFRASNAEEFRESMRGLYGVSRAEVEKPGTFEAWANYIVLGDIALGYSYCSGRMTLHFPENEYVRQQIALRGRSTTTLAGATIDVNPETACTTSMGRPMRLDCDARHERLTLRITTAALERKLTALLGTRPKAALEFEPALDLAQPAAQRMINLLWSFGRLFDAEATQQQPLVLRELEQALIVSFLSANRHPYSPKLSDQPLDTAPRHVRLAEEFIEASWREAISIDKLVEITGVSARVLFRSFRQHRGCTPMEFAKQVRLNQARRMLTDPEASVTSVAYACGFFSTGHFARAYREAFGELPSQTIKRSS